MIHAQMPPPRSLEPCPITPSARYYQVLVQPSPLSSSSSSSSAMPSATAFQSNNPSTCDGRLYHAWVLASARRSFAKLTKHRIMRISLMFPTYALFSFLSVCFPAARVYLAPWLDVKQTKTQTNNNKHHNNNNTQNKQKREMFFANLSVGKMAGT